MYLFYYKWTGLWKKDKKGKWNKWNENTRDFGVICTKTSSVYPLLSLSLPRFRCQKKKRNDYKTNLQIFWFSWELETDDD